jgi:hypothetical protein
VEYPGNCIIDKCYHPTLIRKPNNSPICSMSINKPLPLAEKKILAKSEARKKTHPESDKP